jgi:hypothetical protein
MLTFILFFDWAFYSYPSSAHFSPCPPEYDRGKPSCEQEKVTIIGWSFKLVKPSSAQQKNEVVRLHFLFELGYKDSNLENAGVRVLKSQLIYSVGLQPLILLAFINTILDYFVYSVLDYVTCIRITSIK